MEEKDVGRLLQEAIYCLEASLDFDGPYVDAIRAFADAGIASTNCGLVLTFEDGSEFRVAIVKSK